MSDDVDKWLTRAKRVFESLPDGYEAIVGYGTVAVYAEGTMAEHVGDENRNGWGIDSDLEIGAINFNSKVIPYSEGS